MKNLTLTGVFALNDKITATTFTFEDGAGKTHERTVGRRQKGDENILEKSIPAIIIKNP